MKRTRRTISTGVSFQPDTWEILKLKGNISRYINLAVKEKHNREITKEGKIELLKSKAKEKAKEMAQIQQELKDLKEE